VTKRIQAAETASFGARGIPEEDYLRRVNVRNGWSADADADAAGDVASYVFVRSRLVGGSAPPGDE